jgi:alkylation response protein AidB-like acyl-CoA dehydrogenase
MREPSAEPWSAALREPAVTGQRLVRAASTPEEEVTLELLRASIEKLAPRIDSSSIDRQGKIPDAVVEAARQAGLFALTIDEAHGGLGLSLKATTDVIERMARVDRSVAVMLGLHSGLGTRGLIRYGSAEQKARWLPRLAAGEDIASFAATEAGAGSDLMAVETCGVKVPGGLRVNGRKCYVTNGGFAGLYTILARTPDSGGPRAQSLLCIPRSSPGVQIGPEEDKLGIRGSSTITLDLEDVFVPDDAVLGEPGHGSDHCNHVLAWGRSLMSAGCLGIARAALTLSLGHVTTRRQFGRTLSAFPLVQAQCADMAAQIYAMESLVRLATDAESDPQRLELLSILAKVLCSEGAFLVADRSIQLHGALGFLESTGAPRLLRDCRITRIFEGANDVLLVRTGAALLASGKTDLPAALAPRIAPSLRDAAAACDALLQERQITIDAIRKGHGLSVMRKQAVLWALGQAEVCTGAAVASLLRGGADTDATNLALAEHAACMFTQQAGEQLAAAREPRNETRMQRAQALSDLLYAPYAPRTPSQNPRSRTRSQESPA